MDKSEIISCGKVSVDSVENENETFQFEMKTMCKNTFTI